MSLKAQQSAFEILKFLRISKPDDIRIEDIAFLRGLITIEKNVHGSEGRLVTRGNRGIVTINQRLIATKKRFVIAHELGHFELHRSIGGSICDSEDLLGYHQHKPRENEANEFAAEILMPSFMWDKTKLGAEPNWNSVKEFANHFQTSLTATAFKYINFFNYPVTIICSEESGIKWFFPNNKCFFFHRSIGSEIEIGSLAHSAFANPQQEHNKKIVLASTWFADYNLGQDRYFYEACYFAKKYGQMLSLIWECTEFR